tara:strand:+ start:292 stop:798 length:507 start_codon:yes stop_codon:yes gene_type:complete
MANWEIIGAYGGGQNIDETSTTQKFPLGLVVQGNDIDSSTGYGVGEFIYAKGVASTVVGSVALIDTNGWATSLATANDVGQLGCSMSINVANQFGWYQITGNGVAKGLASLADNKAVYVTGTAGSIDDAGANNGDLIRGMSTVSALDTPSSGLALVSLARPYVLDVTF